ncbi:MAG: TRAP transporter small permease, partial [Paracoccus sp.]|nr:TRAP transporter small permease [Paracoccus sp. (in: a-proteobacteria)]
MLLRFLDRFEEVLISALMATAVTLIFVAVVHRFSLGAAADLVGFARSHDMPGLQSAARSVFK